MDDVRLQWRVGIVVICAAVILAILIFLFGETPWTSQYVIFVQPETAPNVTKNTPVRKNGILIGRVSAVENQDRSVLLTLRIDSDEPVYSNELCKIGTASLLGDSVIDFVPGSEPLRGEPVTDRMMFTNVTVEKSPLELIDVALGLEESVSETLDVFKQAGASVDEAAKGVTGLTSTFQDAFGGEADLQQFLADARSMVANADAALASFSQLMDNVNEIAGDPETREGLKTALRDLPKSIAEFSATMTETRSTISEFRKVAASADENLANLSDFTAALGEQGPEIVTSLNSGLQEIDTLVSEIAEVARVIRESEGTVGKLLKDPSLYNNLNDTMRNVRDLSVKLQPLINDARYFMDGLARDPGQLGVRGMLNRQPVGTGNKPSPFGSHWNNW